MDQFKLVSEYKPSGDQPEAIEALTQGVNLGLREQTLLGVTGSGKTFTMASVIAKLNRPTLVLAHNKTLAAQLCSEFIRTKGFYPQNQPCSGCVDANRAILKKYAPPMRESRTPGRASGSKALAEKTPLK